MAKRPHITRPQHRSGPVTTRHVLEDLAPALRETALRMAGSDPSRVRVLSWNRFEIERTASERT